MKNKSYLIGILFTVLIVVFTAACGNGNVNQPASEPQKQPQEIQATTEPQKQPLKKITYGTIGNVAEYAPIFLAEEEDYWKDFGLEVEYVSLLPSAAVAALINGDVDLLGGGPSVVDAALKTDRIKIIGTQARFAFSIYTQPDVNTLEDLKGKTIGVTQKNSSTDMVLKTTLATVGYKAGIDYQILYSGNSAGNMAALNEKKLDGAVLSVPTTFKADDLGLKQLADLTKTKGTMGFYGIMAVNTAYAEKNPDVIISFLKAFEYAVEQAKSNKEQTMKAIGKFTKADDVSVSERSYDISKNLWPSDFHLPENEIQYILDQLAEDDPKVKSIKVEDIVDNSYADAVKK